MKYCKMLKNYNKYCKYSKIARSIANYILIGNNYIYIKDLGLICLPFSVGDTLRRIGLCIYVIYWMQKLCSLYFGLMNIIMKY